MMKRLRRLCQGLLSLSLLVLGATTSAWPQQATGIVKDSEVSSLSLADAVQTALKGNPMVRQAAAGRAMADARSGEAGAGWFPRVELSSTFTRSNNPVFVFGSLLEQGRFTADHFAVDALNDPAPVNNLRSAASLQVPVFDQFQTSARVEQARLGQDQAHQQEGLVEQRIRFEVVRTYFGVVLAEARERLAGEVVKSAEADVGRIRDLHDAGMVVRSDLLGAEVQLSEFRQEAIQASGDVATAHAALDTVLGVPAGTRHRLAGSLVERPLEVPPESELLQTAVERRPDYATANSFVRGAQEGVRLATGQYLPRLDAFGTYAGSGRDLGVDSTDWMVGAKLSLQLLDLGRGARLDQARAAVSAAMAERDRIAGRIGLEVVGAYRHAVAARERLKVAAGASGQAAEALRIVQDRYQASLTTITEVLRAQTAQLRAHLNELAARYDFYVGYAEVLLAAGILGDVSVLGP
jgi:outer membrane protein TolC